MRRRMNISRRKFFVILFLIFTMALSPTITIMAAQSAPLDSTQRNSMNMLNYLAVLTQGIQASKHSRLFLEEVYSGLLNNTHPNAVDESTHTHLAIILDTLEMFRMIAAQRDRMQYIYDQNRALALNKSLPHPLGLLSLVESKNFSQAAASVVYMAMDVASNYTTFTVELDLQYLQDKWGLDDEESEVLHNIRKQTFSYMVETVNKYSLPGNLALNEKAVDEFVLWKNNPNKVQRLLFLENNRESYQAFGAYWITLAQTYYENGNFSKVLESIAQYETLESQIFRKDYQLAEVMPSVINAARETLDDTDYILFANKSLEKILANTDNSDWSLRFFTAQTFMELYVKTKDIEYLKKAYTVTLSNVNHLANKQRDMNKEYIGKLVETSVPKSATKEKRKEIENYNKLIREERKTALPPVYEPFFLNAELLFFLAGELNIPQQEKVKIEGILHENSAGILLNPTLDALFWFSKPVVHENASNIEVSFNGKELSLPVKYVTGKSEIKVSLTHPQAEDPVMLTDWVIDRVDRKNEHSFDSFVATFKSKAAAQHEYAADTIVLVEVTPGENSEAAAVSFSFKAVPNKTQWWEKVKVWEGNVIFERLLDENTSD